MISLQFVVIDLQNFGLLWNDLQPKLLISVKVEASNFNSKNIMDPNLGIELKFSLF